MGDSGFKAIGVDGCRSGWFYVALSPSRRPDWGVVGRLENLLPGVGSSDRIFVDIPIVCWLIGQGELVIVKPGPCCKAAQAQCSRLQFARF